MLLASHHRASCPPTELSPTPTEELVHMFNELRSDLVLLYELKQACANCEYELQMLPGVGPGPRPS